MEAVAYIRVSTELQALEGVSLEAQKTRITAWAMANRYTLSASYEDAGISGCKTNNRPGLQEAIAHACRTKAALVVYSLSRLARSTKDAITISEQLAKAGADLVSLSEKIDTTTAAGKMIFRMLAVLAEFERDQVSERTSVALRHKRNAGLLAGKVPFGYDLAADGEKLIPNEKEQTALVEMKRMHAQKKSLRQIAHWLEEHGVPTKQGNKVWRACSVRSVLIHSR